MQFVHLMLSSITISIGMLATAQAQIVLDGSIGPNDALSGPNYQIGTELGHQVDSNLFHSFERFNIATGESATFASSSSISNIIARVTGGESSHIDGKLAIVGDASFWFINPAGIYFGENASLDIKGSFHASTADYIGLGSTGRFAATQTDTSTLSSAPPSAFGFLDMPAPITVTGSADRDVTDSSSGYTGLSVPEQQTLSLIGGDITLTNGNLIAPAGQINLISVASAGEVRLTETGPQTDSITQFGNLVLSSSRNFTRSEIDSTTSRGDIDVSGSGGGNIFIYSNLFTLDNGFVFANTLGEQNGGTIDVNTRSLYLSNNSQLGKLTFGAGDAGPVHIVAAEDIDIINNSFIANGTLAAGQGGVITIDTARLSLRDNINSSGSSSNAIVNLTAGTGAAGDVIITAAERIVIQPGSTTRGGNIANNGFDVGDTGNIIITTPDLSINAGFIQAIGGIGNSGNITLNVSNLTLQNGAQIDTRTDESGQGGSIFINASGQILITGRNERDMPSGIFSNTRGAGNAGQLVITATDLQIKDQSAIRVNTENAGNAGNLVINAEHLLLENAEISGSSAPMNANNPPTSLGNAGTLTFNITNDLTIAGGQITTQTFQTGGGGITINNNHIVSLIDGRITTSVNSGENTAGNIAIASPQALSLVGDSLISANAALGQGGNVMISADAVLTPPGLQNITATSQVAGNEGTVTVSSPDTDVSGGLTELNTDFIDATAILNQGCATRTGSDVGRLVIAGRGGLPAGPDATLAASNSVRLSCN